MPLRSRREPSLSNTVNEVRNTPNISEFDHSTRDISVFNSELGMLLDHARCIDEKPLKREFINKIGYLVELLHKNQAPKNAQTYARVRVLLYLIIAI